MGVWVNGRVGWWKVGLRGGWVHGREGWVNERKG